MRLMISGATKNVAPLAANEFFRNYLGVMVTPNTGNSLDKVCELGLPWCVDNGAYDWREFNPDKYLRLLHQVAEAPTRPVFVVVPDQAPQQGETDHGHLHACTAHLFQEWFKVLWQEKLDRLPLAFVAQNGMEYEDQVPWDQIEALFIGGDDDFKLGDFVMMYLIPEAKRQGKWVHMGRVNGGRRIRHAVMAGVDSVDGTSMSRFGNATILKFAAKTVLALQERQRVDMRIAELEEELRLTCERQIPLSLTHGPK